MHTLYQPFTGGVPKKNQIWYARQGVELFLIYNQKFLIILNLDLQVTFVNIDFWVQASYLAAGMPDIWKVHSKQKWSGMHQSWLIE